MKLFLTFLYTAILFYILQMFVEVIVRLFLEYSGLMRSDDFSPNSLFISTALYTINLVFFTKLIISWAYMIIFISLCYFSKEKLRYSLLNLIACLGSGLITFYYEDRFNVILSFYLPIIIANLIIAIGDILISNKRKKLQETQL
jgi:hypothetical protein